MISNIAIVGKERKKDIIGSKKRANETLTYAKTASPAPKKNEHKKVEAQYLVPRLVVTTIFRFIEDVEKSAPLFCQFSTKTKRDLFCALLTEVILCSLHLLLGGARNWVREFCTSANAD